MMENFKNVNHLVLNFYPDGYSIAVKLNEFPVFTSETILETAKIPYEETSLLDYIENEELPPLLVEMIDSSPKLSQYKIWHNGCLILEVRDKIGINSLDGKNNNNSNHGNHDIYNQASQNAAKESTPSHNHQFNQWLTNQDLDNRDDNDCQMHEMTTTSTATTNHGTTKLSNGSFFILLKPTNLSMLYDVLSLTGSNCWSAQDRLQLESQIVLHNSPFLFLEPDATKQPPTEQQHQQQNSQWPDVKISNTYTRNKKKLPHTKLKNRPASKTSVCYFRNGNNHNNSKNTNGNGNNNNRNNNNFYHYNHQSAPESLPPELILQQFLATKRAKRRPFPQGHFPKFQRFKKHLSSNMK